MIDKFLTKVFGSSNQRYLKSIQPIIHQINELEPSVKKLSDDQLRGRTAQFKETVANAVADATDPDDRKRIEREVLEELLPEAFATVREASVRSTGMRHFDVQLMGGLVLHQGKIAEMRTGEGKTLVATLPAYLNALTGRGGVHVVTVNDYLASRDAEWMGQIHRFLGLEVGCIQNDMDDFERQTAYAADITYGTNNEFGFDYLRDNMKFDLATCVQRGHYFAIVDEVDSILIDEARTPLIISGASDEATDKYYKADAIIPQLRKGEEVDGKKTGDYVVDEKQHTAVLTEEGVDKAERLLGVGNLYDPSNMEMLHCVEQSLKAHTLYRLGHQYVVQKGEVIIVDDSTGRLMNGRRWSDGLHQAVEAKEGVRIERENQTLATITLQNYFRLYEKLSGMTGTAETEAAEFHSTYKLGVIVVPTNAPMIRTDFPDMIYRTLPEKWEAVVEEIKACYTKGQPVLVGTVAVENSELISRFLKKEGIPHYVLNAKNHALEAELVARAGRKGAVTIATNMAGRGTDIILGGNPGSMGALQFHISDFLDSQSLVRKLVSRDSPPPSAYLNSKLTATQQSLAECVTFSKPEELAKALSADFNMLLGDLSLYDPKKFESIVLGPETRELIRQTSSEGSSLFWGGRFASDFKDPLSLARKLAAKKDPLSQYFYQYLFSPSLRFGAEDLLDAQSLVDKLAAKKDLPSAYLHSKLPDSTQRLLAAGKSSGHRNEQLIKALVTDLNLLLQGPSLYDEKQFAETLQAETEALLKQNPTKDELNHLNRLLLEDAYPKELARNLYRQLDNSIEANESSEKLSNALAIAFSKLSTGPLLYDEERFSEVVLRDETQQLLRRPVKDDELSRLNRLLLEDAYPLEIAKNVDKPVRLNRSLLEDAYPREIAKKQQDDLLFSVSDFLDIQSVARKLVIRGDSAYEFLHSKLTSNTQQLLAECGTFNGPDESLVEDLAIEFNTLIKGPSLYNPKQFGSKVLRPETKKQLAKDPTGDELELVYLNRLLIEDAYPDEIAKTSLRLDDSSPNRWQEYSQHTKNIATQEHKEVVKLGGLHILGTERHEARRIDNQLRGRSGRQGDPGSSRFFLSLEDDLMRIFAGDRVKALMQRLGMEKGVAIESKMVSKRIEAAQKSVEGRNFESRKHLLEYDDVMNKQRETIYTLRRQLMEEPDQREFLLGDTGVGRDLLADLTKQYINPEADPEDWDVENYSIQLHAIYDFDAEEEAVAFDSATSEEIEDSIWEKLKIKYAEKEQQIGVEAMRTYERIIMLNIIDAQWKDHLLSIDHLKQGIGLVGYGQKDPLVEYKKQSFDLFQEMLDRIDQNTIRSLFNLQIVAEQPPETLRQRRAPRRSALNFTGPNQGASAAGEEAGKVRTVTRDQPKVGRNEPCPCGSGRKYKKCCGA